MEDKLRRYLDELFEETTPTKKTIELKEEMLQNLEDKYRDLLAEGKTPEAAFNIAIAGIGDVNNLLKQLEEGFISDSEFRKHEEARRKSAMLTAIAVMLYILCVLPIMLINSSIAFPIMFCMVAISTGLLVYNNMTKPQYYKESDTVIEEFREWQSGTNERRQMRAAISSALWSLIFVLYFIISFTTHAWHITWVIFIIGGLVESLISIFFAMKNKGR